MNQVKRHSSAGIVVAALLVMLLGVAPAWAEHGSTDTTTSTNTSTSTANTESGSSGSSSSSGSANTDTGSHTGKDSVESTSTTGTKTETETETETKDGLRTQAKSLLDEKRKDMKETSIEHRQTACEAHKTEIDTRANNYAAAAQRHLDTFNGIFTKVQNFYTSKQLNVSGYATLVAAAQAKQTAAQTAVDNLTALNVNIDCTSTDPATSVATLKTAVSDARTALQAYRQALKDLITAIKGASSSQTNTSTSTTEGK